MRRQLFSFVLLLAFAFAAFSMPVTAQEQGSGGIGGRPANPREDNPRSKSIFVHTIEPGSSVDDGVKVINNSDQTRSVIIYATDSVNSSGGAFACKQKVEPKDGVGSWIELAKNKVTLEPAKSQVVEFTISVPAGTDVGEHNGCIVIQEEKPEQDIEEGIGLNFRTALRTAILVPGETVKQLEIVDFTNSLTGDGVILTPKVSNTGNVSVDGDVFTTLNYPFGIELSSVGGQYPILRDQISEWNFEHDKPFWGGFVLSKLSVAYNDEPGNFIGDSDQNTVTLNADGQWIFVLPHPIALALYIVVLALIVATIYLLIKSRRRKNYIKKNWKSYSPKAGDDIKSIAKTHSIGWKKLARANKLKAPYTIDPSKAIKVPPQKPKK